jgi:hypothetical protein
VGGAWFWNGLFWLGVVAEGRFLWGVKWEGGRGAGRRCMLCFFRRLCWWARTVSLYYVLSCGHERVMIFCVGGMGGAPVFPTIE